MKETICTRATGKPDEAPSMQLANETRVLGFFEVLS